MNKLVVGCGYLGEPVAERWLRAGHRVHVVTRSVEHARRFSSRGLIPILGDITRPETLADLPEVEHVLCAVGYDRQTGLPIKSVYVDGLKYLLDTLPATVTRFVYISSSGVYGQNDGSWVDENSACHPAREGGIACLEAEQCLQRHALGERSIILRMCGIYGPGRVPRMADIQKGEPLATPARGYLNLIHRDDAIRAVLLAELNPVPPELILVGDGNPVLRRNYFECLAKLLGAPIPRFASPQETAHVSARALSDKRIVNQRMLDCLKINLQYPSFREGLESIVNAGK